MRLLIVAVVAFVVLSGCLATPGVPHVPAAISLDEARGYLDEAMDGQWTLVRATMSHELEGTPDGRGQAWLLEIDSHAGRQAFQITAHGAVTVWSGPSSQSTAGTSPAATCDIRGDSTNIAGGLASSRAWKRLDMVNATHAQHTMRTLEWEASCAGGHTVWAVHGPLLQNEGGTWSQRAFWLDGRGLLAGFFGDPSVGHPVTVRSPTAGGINVERHMAFGEPAAGGVSQGTFETQGAVQLAIVATVEWQGIDVPIPDGTLTAIGPTGEAYATPWVQSEASAVLFLPEADPDDAQGDWTVQLAVESPLMDVFDARFDICTGVVFVPDSEACQALFDLQNGA